MAALRKCLLVLTLVLAGKAWAQKPKPRPVPPVPYQAVDARMQQVPDSSARTVAGLARYIKAAFVTEDDRARAAFGWVARNIRYDVENMYVLEYERAPAVVVQETLDKRQGVCRHYAELYSAVANQAGIATYVVAGYNSLRAAVGHAWCASRIDGKWQLMEPTWAAGRIENNRFGFRFNDEHFRVPAKTFIETHMPYDPLWQLLPAPRTPQQFQEGVVPPASTPKFAFADSIAEYGRQTPAQRLHAVNRRIEQNGVKNGLIYTYLSGSKNQEVSLHIENYNNALVAFNQGTKGLNAFIDFFNRQFQPRKTDDGLRQLLPPVAGHLAQTRTLLAAMNRQSAPQLTSSLKELDSSLKEAEEQLTNCEAFMVRYLGTNKLLRPTLFMAISNLNGRHEMTR